MLLKARRFVNSKLDDIVDLYKKDKNRELTFDEAGLWKSIKTSINVSRGKFFDKYLKKKYDIAYNKFENKFDELKEKLDNKEISEEEFDKKMERPNYKLDKAEYVLGYDETKPKNPIWKNMKEAISKGLTATKNFMVRTGNGIKKFVFKKVPLMLETGAKQTFKAGYKLGKHTIKGVKKFGRGFRFVGKGVRFVGNKVAEATKDIREQADLEMAEKAKQKQEEKEEKRKTPRENLGMEEIEIDHEQAIEKVEGEVVREKPEQQLENE